MMCALMLKERVTQKLLNQINNFANTFEDIVHWKFDKRKWLSKILKYKTWLCDFLHHSLCSHLLLWSPLIIVAKQSWLTSWMMRRKIKEKKPPANLGPFRKHKTEVASINEANNTYNIHKEMVLNLKLFHTSMMQQWRVHFPLFFLIFGGF